MSLASLQAIAYGRRPDLRALPQEERLDAFIARSPYLSDQEYWETLGHLWVVAASPGYHGDEWRALFESPRPGREYLMNDSERRTLAMLPEQVQVYRSATFEARHGLSWTTDLAITWLFKYRRKGDQIWTAMIDKADVLAFFEVQQEIVADAKHPQLYEPEVT